VFAAMEACTARGEKKTTDKRVSDTCIPHLNNMSQAPAASKEDWQTFGIQELDDEVVLEDVDLLDCRNGIDSYSLERALQPLVVRGGRLVDSLLLPEQKLKFF